MIDLGLDLDGAPLAVLSAILGEQAPESLDGDDPSVPDLEPTNVEDVLEEACWTPEVVELLALDAGVGPVLMAQRLKKLRAEAAEVRDSMDGEALNFPGIKLKLSWIRAAGLRWMRRSGAFPGGLDAEGRNAARLMLLARQRGAFGEEVYEDADLLHLVRHWELHAEFAMQRAGRMLLEPGGEARLRGILDDVLEARAADIARARADGLSLEDGEAAFLASGLEESFWKGPRATRRFRGLDPGEEGLALLGRYLGSEEEEAGDSQEEQDEAKREARREIDELLEQARGLRGLIEAWQKDSAWTRADLALWMDHQEWGTVRDALDEQSPVREALVSAQRLRELRDRARLARRYTEPVAVVVLAGYWGVAVDRARERVRGALQELFEGSRERLVSVLARRSEWELETYLRRAADHARAMYTQAFAPGAELEGKHPDRVAGLIAAAWEDERYLGVEWDPPRAAMYAASLRAGARGPDGRGFADLVQLIEELEQQGAWPEALRLGAVTLVDLAELADARGRTLRQELEALDGADPARVEGRVRELRAAREGAGRGDEPCSKAFCGHPMWWPEDAGFVARARGVDPAQVEAWIGHRLLKGAEAEVESFMLDERVHEQALFRNEQVGRPYVILVLQGGGAKAAYQVGVIDALESADLGPSWVLGISSGALNAATYAGNPAGLRIQRLGELWKRLTNRWARVERLPRTARPLFKIAGAMAQLAYKPDFYRPHGLPPALCPPGTDAATSFFSNDPLQAMLEDLVDFRRIAREAEVFRRTAWSRRCSGTPVRITVGTTEVRTGQFVWWDSVRDRVGVEHVLASGAMPPGAPGVRIDGRLYWDGGVVGNNPLQPVLEEMLDGNLNGRDVLVVFVDLWGSEDWEPTTLAEVQLRQTQLDFAGRVEASIERFRANLLLEVERRRRLPKRSLLELDPYGSRRRGFGALDPRTLAILRIENGRRPEVGQFDPMDFSADSIAARREQGRQDMREALTRAPWEADVRDDRIGGAIYHFRQGRLIDRTEAIDVAQVPKELLD